MKLFGAFLGITGIVLIGVTSGWLPAVGVFLVTWGNNIERIE